MPKPFVPNSLEDEFIAEMAHEPGTRWANFDPPFTRNYVRRLETRGFLETDGRGRDARHRWTEAGVNMLAQLGAEPAPQPVTMEDPADADR